jgi:hypothetical protein
MAAQDKSSVVTLKPADSLDHSPLRRSTRCPPGLPEILGISGVKYRLQQLERTRAVKLTTVRVVVVELKVQSSKPAALLLKNQRDEMKLNDH